MNQQFKNDIRENETIFHVIPDELIEEARLDTGSSLKSTQIIVLTIRRDHLHMGALVH